MLRLPVAGFIFPGGVLFLRMPPSNEAFGAVELWQELLVKLGFPERALCATDLKLEVDKLLASPEQGRRLIVCDGLWPRDSSPCAIRARTL